MPQDRIREKEKAAGNLTLTRPSKDHSSAEKIKIPEADYDDHKDDQVDLPRNSSLSSGKKRGKGKRKELFMVVLR